MPTQTKTDPVSESVETAAERVTELNDKAVANGKKAGAMCLSLYEKAVLSLADSYEKAAGSSRVEWIASVATAQAGFSREVTKAYTSVARDFVS